MTRNYQLDDVKAVMRRVASALSESENELTKLDQALGDGDLGITAVKISDALLVYIKDAGDDAGNDLGRFIAGAGMAANRVASSTMGTLLATAAMRAGRVVKGADSIAPAQLGEMLNQAGQGMRERGKASLGDKTILDAIFPAAEAFSAALANDKPLAEAARKMVDAAKEGRDAVTPLRSKIGRAGWIGERGQGMLDPGCQLCVIVLEAMANSPVHGNPGR